MKLKITKNIENFLTENNLRSKYSGEDLGQTWIEHSVAVRIAKDHNIPLYEFLKGSGASSYDFDQLNPPPSPKTEEYVQLMNKLREIESNRLNPSSEAANSTWEGFSSGLSISEKKEIKEQLTAIINVLVSMVAVAFAFWYWCSSWKITSRLLMSLFGGLVTAVAEVFLFGRYWTYSQNENPNHKDSAPHDSTHKANGVPLNKQKYE